MPALVVPRRQIEVHFAGELRLEFLDLQLDNNEAAQPKVVEQEVEIVILIPSSRWYWLATKANPLPSSRMRARRCSSNPCSSSRSVILGPSERKSKLYGSLMSSCARSD